jgi:hypothetical protein
LAETIASDKPFSAEQRRQLAWLAGQMIPATNELPGADSDAVQAETLRALARHVVLVAEALAGLGEIADENQAMGQLDQFRAEHPAFIQVFQQAVIASYYRQDAVLESLGLPARAPFPQGNEVASTDWSLLDPVRSREPFYRQVD